MLIPTRHPREKTYYVEFAKWSGFTNATDPEEAATLLFEEVLEKYRDHTEVSPVFTVVNLSKLTPPSAAWTPLIWFKKKPMKGILA